MRTSLFAASFFTVSGVAATRVSPGRVSAGTPIRMGDFPLVLQPEAGILLYLLAIKVCRLHELLAQGQRRRDIPDRFFRRAGAADRDRAVVEQPAGHALLDMQGLDLVEEQLDRAAGNEPGLGDDPPVGDGE